jgi:hypothetical protein
MSVAHKSAFEEALKASVGQPKQAEIFNRYHAGLIRGFYDQQWVDVVLQSQHNYPYTLADAAGFAVIWNAIQFGQILHVRIPTDTPPSPDNMLRENESVLQRISFPFKAMIWGGNAEQDGLLEWKEPIQLARTQAGNALEILDLKEGSAPLEIGYTAASKTLSHLNRSRCVARWPYGHDCVTLIVLHGTESLPVQIQPRLKAEAHLIRS